MTRFKIAFQYQDANYSADVLKVTAPTEYHVYNLDPKFGLPLPFVIRIINEEMRFGLQQFYHDLEYVIADAVRKYLSDNNIPLE